MVSEGGRGGGRSHPAMARWPSTLAAGELLPRSCYRGAARSSGMKISRRPNSQASIECAPGPSIARAIASAPTNAADCQSMPTPAMADGPAAAMARVDRHTPAAAPGVRSPATSAMALRTASHPSAQSPLTGSACARNDPPCRIAAPPATARSSNKPAPGHRPGKVEKSRCSPVLLVMAVDSQGPGTMVRKATIERIPRDWNPLVPPSWYPPSGRPVRAG